jgi:hypothetical protein
VDLKLILIDGLIGAVFGGVGALATTARRKSSDAAKSASRSQGALSVLPAVIAVVVASALHWDAKLLAAVIPPDPREEITARYGKLLADDPAFAAYLKNQPDPSLAGQQLSSRGMHRLNVGEVRAATRGRLSLANQSAVVCTGMWTGKTDPNAVALAIESLPLPELEAFMKVTTSAALHELHADQPPLAPPADPRAALDAAVAVLGDRGPELDRILTAGLDASPEDGCRGVKLLYEAIARLPDEEAREVFAIATQ